MGEVSARRAAVASEFALRQLGEKKAPGRSAPRAALIYQHAGSGADRAIAEALDLLIEAAAKLGQATEDQDDEASGAMVPAW